MPTMPIRERHQMGIANSIKSLSLLGALAALLLAPTQGLADPYDDLESAELEAEQAKAAYDDAVARYEQVCGELEDARTKVQETETALDAERVEAGKSALYLYKSEMNPSSLVDSFLSTSNFASVLAQFDALDRIYSYHYGEFDRLIGNAEEFKAAVAELEKTEADERARKEELESQMDETLYAYREAQSAAEEEAEREAEEERLAAERAAEESEESNDEDEDKNDEATLESNSFVDVPQSLQSEVYITLDEFMFMGIVYANGYKYSYYSESVLDGSALSIPGRHHDSGLIVDGEGRVATASSDLPVGTLVPVPFEGRIGCVYDCGCDPGTIDIYIE